MRHVWVNFAYEARERNSTHHLLELCPVSDMSVCRGDKTKQNSLVTGEVR